MIRQNIDGRPIYSYHLWCEMLESGQKLKKLGSLESINKPNLFYKLMEGYNPIYADLRGHEEFPIWEDSGLNMYYYGDMPSHLFIKELIVIQRSGCRITSFSDRWIEDDWKDNIYDYYSYDIEIPDGYCKTCHRDIFDSIKFESLSGEGKSQKIELCYCDDCKIIKYKERKILRERQIFQQNKSCSCRLCGTIKEELLVHHITYEPEETMKICNSCHGIIHTCSFPSYLWKQKKSDYLATKRNMRQILESKKPLNQFTCLNCGEYKIDKKKNCKCPNCGKSMEIIEYLSNFCCAECHKIWKGIASHDYCLDCAINYYPEMNEKDKKAIKINIQHLEDSEEREKYGKLYNL